MTPGRVCFRPSALRSASEQPSLGLKGLDLPEGERAQKHEEKRRDLPYKGPFLGKEEEQGVTVNSPIRTAFRICSTETPASRKVELSLPTWIGLRSLSLP